MEARASSCKLCIPKEPAWGLTLLLQVPELGMRPLRHSLSPAQLSWFSEFYLGLKVKHRKRGNDYYEPIINPKFTLVQSKLFFKLRLSGVTSIPNPMSFIQWKFIHSVLSCAQIKIPNLSLHLSVSLFLSFFFQLRVLLSSSSWPGAHCPLSFSLLRAGMAGKHHQAWSISKPFRSVCGAHRTSLEWVPLT